MDKGSILYCPLPFGRRGSSRGAVMAMEFIFRKQGKVIFKQGKKRKLGHISLTKYSNTFAKFYLSETQAVTLGGKLEIGL